jgi:hypothetical protein
MDSIDAYRRIIQEVFGRYTYITYANGDIQNETIFDQQHDRYLVMSQGWDDARRIHGCLLHAEIIDGKAQYLTYFLTTRHDFSHMMGYRDT